MKKYELHTAYPCLIKWKNGEEFLDDGLALVFDEPQKLFVYPATGRREDVSFVLDMASNNFANIFDTDDKRIFYLDNNHDDFIIAKENMDVSDKHLNIEIGSSHLKVDDGEVIKIIEILPPKTYELFSCEEFAIIKLKSLTKMQAVIYNVKTRKLQSLTATAIEINGNEIILTKGEKDEKYLIAEGNLSYVRGIETLPRNYKVLGMSFLQDIKCKKYKEACALLSNRLNASEDKLIAYFGEIENVIPIDKNQFLLIKKSSYNVCKLDIKDDLIVNIEID